ncbi:hypothetical protein CCMSSC00406_0002658 [Pleurotus cornucopiae]|uniref:Uncharacterized protein n=1 Tax=Pleurotus cornucopiae TaxID=5321 RepID=A0ACB7IVT2_PLECO|nr:hypothetical protein CCMSSC00406_0002658 [Pleurotus cornucopiae]
MRDCDYCTSCDEDKSARAGMGKKSMDWGMGSMDSADMNIMGVGMGTGKPHISTASAISATNPPFPPAPMSRTSPSTMHTMHMSPASTPSATSPATRSTTPQVESLSTSTSGRRHHRVAEFPPSASPSHLSRSSLSSPPPHSTSRSSNAITFDEVRKRMRGPLFLPEPTLAELDFKSYSDAEGAIMISSAPALMSRPPLRNYGKDDSMKRNRKRKQGLLLRRLLYDDGEKEEKTEANGLGLGKKDAKSEVTGILEESSSRCRRCRKEYLVEMNTPRTAHETPLQYSALFAAPLSDAVVNAEDAGDTCKEDKRPEQTRRSGLWLSLVSKSCLEPSLTLASTSSTFLDLPSSPTLSSPSLASSSLSPTPTPSSPSPSSSSLSSDGASSSTSSASSLISTATSSSSLITTPTSSPCTSPEGKEYLTSGIVDEPLLNTNNNQTPQGVSSRFSGFSLRSWLSPYVSGTESTSPLDHVDALNNFDTLPLPDIDEPELGDHHSLKGNLLSEEETACSCYHRRLRHPRSHLPFSSNATGGHRHRKLERTLVTFGDCPLSTTRADAPAFLSATAATNEQPTQASSLAVPRIIPSLSLGRALSSHLVTVGKVLQQFKQFHTAYVGAVAGFAVIDGGNENYGVAGVGERGGQSADKVIDARDWLMGAQGVGMGRGMGGVMYGVGVRRGVGGGGPRSPAGYGERAPEETAAKVRGQGRIRVRRKKSGYRAKKEDVANVFPPQAVAPPSVTTAAAMTMKEVAVSRAAAGFRSPISGTHEELDNEGDDLRVVELAPLSRRTLSSSGSSRGRRRLTSSTSFVASSTSYSPYNPNSLHPPSSSSSPSSSRSSSSSSRISSTSSSKPSYSPYAHSADHIIAPSTSTPTAAVKKMTTPIYLRPIANPVYLRLKAVQNVVRVMTYGTGSASSNNTVSSSADEATATAVDVVGATISSGLANPLLRDTSASASTTPSTSASTPASPPPPDVDPATITDRKVTIEDTASALALGLLRAGAMGSGRERVCGVGGGGRRRSLLGMGSLCADVGVECC